MSECPLCSNSTVEAYQHICHSFILCLACIRYIDPSVRRFEYIFCSIVNIQLSPQAKKANKQLKAAKIKPNSKDLKRILTIIFEKSEEKKQSSQSLTISTQESDSKEFEVRQKSTKEYIDEKYQDTVKVISKQLSSMKQPLLKTKEKIISSTIGIKQNLDHVKQQYNNFSAQLPSISSIFTKSMKMDIGGFLKKFY